MHLRELALALLLAGCAEAGFYSGGKSAVLELDGKNFAREILDSKNAAVRSLSLCPTENSANNNVYRSSSEHTSPKQLWRL